jgi:hypothetical protein
MSSLSKSGYSSHHTVRTTNLYPPQPATTNGDTMPRKRRQARLKYHARPLIEQFHPHTSARQLAQLFQVHPGTIQRWRNPHTTLTQWEADRYAIRLGKHPSEIWADWFDID